MKALGDNANDVVRRQWPPNTLQLELTHRLDLHGTLNHRQHAGVDEDLSRLGFVAKTRGDVGYRPDGGVVETPLEANSAQRGKPMRYADTAEPYSQALFQTDNQHATDAEWGSYPCKSELLCSLLRFSVSQFDLRRQSATVGSDSLKTTVNFVTRRSSVAATRESHERSQYNN